MDVKHNPISNLLQRNFITPLLKGRAMIWRPRSWLYSYRVPSEKMKSFIQRKKFSFILGTGRSGTQLLSGLLEKADESTAYHEPNVFEDRSVMAISRRNHDFSMEYIDNFRKYEIYWRARKKPDNYLYTEVTGMLRYHAKALRRVFPEAKILLLVRDGRDVIRSIMTKSKFYAPGAAGAKAISPSKDELEYPRWKSWGRFEKICWLWKDSYEILLEQIPGEDFIRLESVLTDYEYFQRQVLEKLNLDIPFEIWRKSVGQKSKNATRVHSFPAYSEWTSSQKSFFQEMCGDLMDRFGYQIES